jgi:hypothetical protein
MHSVFNKNAIFAKDSNLLLKFLILIIKTKVKAKGSLQVKEMMF